MADTAEKIQNLNIQDQGVGVHIEDFDGSDFDPYSPGNNKMESVPNGEQAQTMDLLGGFNDPGHVNGTDKHVSFDQDAGIGLPDPSYISQGQGQPSDIQRHMSEGEILGYQNEYGEMSSHQGEYHGDSDQEDQNNIVNFEGTDLDQVGDNNQSQGHSNSGEYSSPDRDSSQNDYDQYVENDYVEENPSGVQIHKEYVEEAFDGGYENDDIDPDNWQPEMDPERLRRSQSPERSVSPMVRHDQSNIEHESVSEMSQPQAVGGVSEASTIPISPDYTESADLISQSSQMMSETESLDSRSECEGTPRRRRIPKPKKKSLELPPWDDNVVIPPMPRMKPTLIGKQADVAPMSPPPRLQRPRTAPARHSAKDASSDSGVEEDKASMRQNSADTKRKYGTDTKNERYKPGGGNVQVFHQKMIDTKYVAPRTDTTKPKSALMSPRISPSKEKAPTPKPPTPNTKSVQSKIGSLNNVKHTPGGGNIKVLNAKVDFSSVSSKVGSKEKIHHQPKGGDKKIESRKLTWQTDSKVGSLKNVTHSPGGGNVKVCIAEVHQTMNTEEDTSTTPEDNVLKQRLSWSAHSRVGSFENSSHTPGGGNIKILDQKVEIKAQSKVGSTANLKHKPGGGDKKIETQKLEFKDTAKSKVGSMDKVKHKPGGGDIKIFNESPKWETSARVKSLENASYSPGGGVVKIVDEKPVWTAAPKVESLANADHIPGGGNVKILDEKVDFTGTAKPKVGSMDKVKHQPGGGDKKIETQKLTFKETAKARTDTGGSTGEKRKSCDNSRSASVTSSQDGSVQD